MKGLSLYLDLEFKDGRTQSSPIRLWNAEDVQKGQLEEIYIPIRFSEVKRAFLSAKFNAAKENVLDTPLYIEYEIIDKLPMQIPDAGFTEHLSDVRNHKILFSGKFGQGKSTFLDYYFKEREDQYNVFRLFPVNYSVASNQDIFRYIKCELIFQLLADNSEFYKENTNVAEVTQQVVKENARRVLSPLIELIPGIGKSSYQLINKYKELFSEYVEYLEERKIDDKKFAEEYLKYFPREQILVFNQESLRESPMEVLNKINELTQLESLTELPALSKKSVNTSYQFNGAGQLLTKIIPINLIKRLAHLSNRYLPSAVNNIIRSNISSPIPKINESLASQLVKIYEKDAELLFSEFAIEVRNSDWWGK